MSNLQRLFRTPAPSAARRNTGELFRLDERGRPLSSEEQLVHAEWQLQEGKRILEEALLRAKGRLLPQVWMDLQKIEAQLGKIKQNRRMEK